MNEERLTGSPFLSLKPLGLDFSPWLADLTAIATVSHHPKRSRLTAAGDQLSDIIFLMEGAIIDSVANINGLEKCTLTFAPYPHWLAPAWHHMPLLYASTAYTDVTLWHFPREAFISIMKESEHFLYLIMRFSALETRRLYHQSYLQYAVPAHVKIAQVLSFYHYLRLQDALPEIRLTQSLIAQLSGVHRTSVAQSLQTLRKEGLLLKQPETPLSPEKEAELEKIAFIDG
ncbi:Crp/Fnr family transcriptional regulator [Peptococcus simiae]|uniref:Crp/Fnr family transcriptional regulator n=1 Tax=Peptococcus simiae TaxID=1643805 RepID=A0ABW9GZM1_9FIRM